MRPASAGAPPAATQVCGAALAALVLLLAHSAAAAPEDAASAAAAWLPSVQNADGSWGATEDIRPLYTAAVVSALRAYNERSPAYFRGVTWLESRGMGNVDYRARRVTALAPHGDDVTADRALLAASLSLQLPIATGWGLSTAYAPSARDTALVLLAFGVLGVEPDVSAAVQSALDFLALTQAGDGSWTVSGATAGSPVVTALALRALAAHAGFDPTVVTNGNLAASYLQGNVAGGSSALQQAHAALALLRWSGPGSATSLLSALELSQAADGSWEGDAYTTAVALEALAAELGRDTPTYQEIVAVDDYALRSALNASLGRSNGDALRRGDLQELTALDASGLAISDLTGLEEATNLALLDLRGTDVSDITPIAGLVGTTTILLQNTPWAGLMCDVNDDGAIDVGDALLATRIASWAHAPSLLEQTRADIAPIAGPGDGVVDAGDALLVTRRAGGTPSPVCP